MLSLEDVYADQNSKKDTDVIGEVVLVRHHTSRPVSVVELKSHVSNQEVNNRLTDGGPGLTEQRSRIRESAGGQSI